MKTALAFLVFAVLGMNLCIALPKTEPNCKWTGCEGLTRFGVNICNEYSAGRYTGNTNTEGCDWKTQRVECCLPYPPGTVKWSNCYGVAYSAGHVCKTDYGQEFRPTGNKKDCSSCWGCLQYECKN